jgi:tripartite ATP-independent transporter DctM subunit
MSTLQIGLAGVAGLLLLLTLRVPISVALAAAGLCGYAAIDGWGKTLRLAASIPFELASAYSLAVVPLFILMGAVASRAQMSRELFEAANALFSGFKGALANATIGACAAFCSICGSSVATAATFSQVAIPEMKRHGYDQALASGSVAAAGTLGILIPPSIILAVYALVAEQSLSKLFAAALVPGLCLAALYVVMVMIVVRVRPDWAPRVPAMAIRERLRAAVGMWKLLLLFTFAVVGIYVGWFSPNEAAAISAFTAIVIGFSTKTLNWRSLYDALSETVLSTAMLFFVIAGAFIFSRFIVLTRLPNELADWVQAAGWSPGLIITAVIALYFVLGTALEEVSTILITVPVILPLMASIGYDGVWFGIFVTVMATIGLISPPVGLTVFVIQAQNPDIPVTRIYLGTTPFLAADFILVALLIAFPGLALWLPGFLGL